MESVLCAWTEARDQPDYSNSRAKLTFKMWEHLLITDSTLLGVEEVKY